MRAVLQAPAAAQRMCADCAEEARRTPEAAAHPAGDVSATVARGTVAGGSPLPARLRHFFEPRFGADFNQVRLHTGFAAADSARALDARAYTVGGDVVFGAGEYAPDTFAGRRLLAHELSYTLQQTGAPARAQRAPAANDDCPARERGEVEASATSPFRAIERAPQQEWNIYDFRVGSGALEPAKGDVGSLVEDAVVGSLSKGHLIYVTGQDPVEVLAYSDCHGSDRRNEQIRKHRAANFCAAVKDYYAAAPKSYQRFFRSCRPAPLAEYIVANDTKEHRSQNRGVLIRALPAAVSTSRFPYDETYGPTDANCAAYKAVGGFFNRHYAHNAYCACTGTPDEPHNNCVRKCLQSKMWTFIAAHARDLQAGRFVWCPTIWRHHRECYQECGCDRGFIDYVGFYPVCEESFSCQVNSLAIALVNRCMDE